MEPGMDPESPNNDKKASQSQGNSSRGSRALKQQSDASPTHKKKKKTSDQSNETNQQQNHQTGVGRVRGRSRATSGAGSLASRIKKDDIVMTSKGLGIVKTITQSTDGVSDFQYGVVLPDEGASGQMRFLSDKAIMSKIQSEKILTMLAQFKKGFDQANSDIMLKENELRELTKQYKESLIQISSLKQSVADTKSNNIKYNKKIKAMEATKKKLEKENRTLRDDIKTLRKATPTKQMYNKQIQSLNKQKATLNEAIKQQDQEIQKLKNKLMQLKSKSRVNLDDAKDANKKDLVLLRKELEKTRQMKVVLEKENSQLKKRLSSRNGQSGLKNLEDQYANQEKLLKIKQRKMQEEKAKIKKREEKINQEKKRQAALMKNKEKSMQQKVLDKQKQLESKNKRLLAKERQNNAAAQRLKQQEEELEKQRSMLAKAKKTRIIYETPNIHRHEWRKREREKVIVHRKFLVKEYYNSVEKLRNKKDLLNKHGPKIKNYEKQLEELVNKLHKLETEMKMQENSDDAPDSKLLDEYLNIENEIEDLENEIDKAALDLHSQADEIQRLEVELLQKENECDELEEMVETLKQQLQDGVSMDDSKSDVSSLTDFDDVIDETSTNNQGDSVNNDNNKDEQFSNQFLIIRKMMARPDMNAQELKDELHGLIRKIGERLDEPDLDMNENKNEFVSDEQLLQDLSNEYEMKKTAFEKFLNDENRNFDDEMNTFENYENEIDKMNEQLNHILSKNGNASLKAKDIEKQLELEKENIGNCESMMEQLGKENCDEQDLTDLRKFDSKIENSLENLEDYRTKLKHDDKEANKLLAQLKDEKIKLKEERLKSQENEFENLKSKLSNEAQLRMPDILTLKDLRKRLKLLQNDISINKEHLNDIHNNIDSLLLSKQDIEDEFNDLLPPLHDFKRRPNKKIKDLIFAWNSKLEKICKSIEKQSENISKYFDKLDDTETNGHKLDCDLLIESFIFDEYVSKYPNSMESNEKNALIKNDKSSENKEDIDDTSDTTEEATMAQCKEILDFMKEGMTECTEDIGDNFVFLRSQQLSCLKLLEKINDLKEILVQALPKPLPELKEMEEDADMSLIEESRNRHRDDYESEFARKLAGLTTYDKSETINLTLLKIHSLLGAISPLHFYTVSNYLVEPLSVIKKELIDLEQAFARFLKVQSMAQMGLSSPHSHENTNENMLQELRNYTTQGAKDLASDYHYTSKPKVLESNIALINKQLKRFEQLQDKLETTQELEYLRKMYKSFLDPVYPQPIPNGNKIGVYGKLKLGNNNSNSNNNSGNNSEVESPSYQNNDGIRVETTNKEQFRTSLGYQYAGLSVNDTSSALNDALDGIDKHLYSLRGEIMPLGFNIVYQDAMMFGMFPGDNKDNQNKIEAYGNSLSVPNGDGNEVNGLALANLNNMIGMSNGGNKKKYNHGMMSEEEDEMENDETMALMHFELNIEKLSKDDKSKLIFELMELEWEYNELLVNREDDATQSDLYERAALYYRRLFSEPLDDIYLEQDRSNLLNDVQSYQMQQITMQNIAKGDNDVTSPQYQMMRTLMHQTQGVIHGQDENNDKLEKEDDDGIYADERKILERQFDKGFSGFETSKLKNILESHQRFENGVPIDQQIDDLCRDCDNWENKYKYVSHRANDLQFENQRLESELDNAIQEKEAFEEENHFLRQFKGTQDGPKTKDALSLQEMDILQQIRENLNECYQDAATSKLPGKSLLSQTRSQLRTMRSPLDDLANDFDSKELRQAHEILGNGIDSIKRQEKGKNYNKKPLLNNIKDMIDEIDGMMKEFEENAPSEYNEYVTPMGPKMITPGQTNPNWKHEPMDSINVKSGDLQEMEMKYPDLVNDPPPNATNGHTNGHTNGESGNNNTLPPEQWPRQQTKFRQFDDNFPTIVNISIEGKFFKKYPLCHIEYDGAKFSRKMKHFQWLWRMLLLDARADRPVPDYPTDMPESLWPQGYLRRRKRELNLFLMNCHSTEWIKNHKSYYSVFLAATDAKFKQRKKDYDLEVIERAKKSIAKAKHYEKQQSSRSTANNSNNNSDDSYDDDDDDAQI